MDTLLLTNTNIAMKAAPPPAPKGGPEPAVQQDGQEPAPFASTWHRAVSEPEAPRANAPVQAADAEDMPEAAASLPAMAAAAQLALAVMLSDRTIVVGNQSGVEGSAEAGGLSAEPAMSGLGESVPVAAAASVAGTAVSMPASDLAPATPHPMRDTIEKPEVAQTVRPAPDDRPVPTAFVEQEAGAEVAPAKSLEPLLAADTADRRTDVLPEEIEQREPLDESREARTVEDVRAAVPPAKSAQAGTAGSDADSRDTAEERRDHGRTADAAPVERVREARFGREEADEGGGRWSESDATPRELAQELQARRDETEAQGMTRGLHAGPLVSELARPAGAAEPPAVERAQGMPALSGLPHEFTPLPAAPSVSIALEQSDLGSVQLRVSLADRTVHANMTSDRPEVRTFVAAHERQIETGLKGVGLELGGLHVSSDSAGGGRLFQGWQGQAHPYVDRSRREEGYRDGRVDAPVSVPVERLTAVSLFA
jgi:flagellar hook-length control protein FliK